MMEFSTRSINQGNRFSVVGTRRAQSVAGGAGNIRMSSANVSMASVRAPAFSEGLDAGFFSSNSKETMNNLNDRLAAYLERVRSLEQSNNDLEMKIREFYEKKATVSAIDTSGFHVTIRNLRAQIAETTTNNTRLVLQIDNAKLAADDFKMKHETELAMRLGVEKDITGLRKFLDQLSLERCDLELQIESLKEDLIILKRDHEEALAAHKVQNGGNVNVEVDFAEPVDLSKILAEVRQQYEDMVEKKRQEMEIWYQAQNENLYKEVAVCQTSVETSSKEITELKRSFQSLSIERQSLLHMKQAMESTLAETNNRYGSELVKIQNSISQIELDLQQVRSDYEHHSREYALLLDIKTILEQEIATYRRLLDGEDSSILSATQLETNKNIKIVSKEQAESSTTQVTTVRTIVEEVVDGKVVSSSSHEESLRQQGKSIREEIFGL
ncbi:LOW QUALITY PROTEIN: keratin, type I cytoskeletal 47 kDa-like [Engystomops pustulosus]|uniref:LOW QUALITY PROTEIN: keratin, type I cytoskeletal 47 kDa-like n=1 Tax=Engystomops pustulosus TaxID=76066 RepID=UPI003AFA92AF